MCHPLTAPADLWRFYRGSSMLAIFRPGDYLVIEMADFTLLAPGDVIVFCPQEPDSAIVHRIIEVLPEGLRTRGDTNRHPDQTLVTPGMLLGQVIAFERRGRRVKIWGGKTGLLQAKLAGWLRRGRLLPGMWLRWLGRIPWRVLRSSKLARLAWNPPIQRVKFAAGEDFLVKYICGGRVVARWRPASGAFQVEHPYDLIISKPED